MRYFGDKSKPIYEIEMDVLNLLTGKYVRCFDYLHAENEDEARTNARWIYGQSMEIVTVRLDADYKKSIL